MHDALAFMAIALYLLAGFGALNGVEETRGPFNDWLLFTALLIFWPYWVARVLIVHGLEGDEAQFARGESRTRAEDALEKHPGPLE